MDARLNLFHNTLALKFVKHINAASRVIAESSPPRATQELVKIRASHRLGTEHVLLGVGAQALFRV